MMICGTYFARKTKKKTETLGYKIPPHFQWSEQQNEFNLFDEDFG